MRELEKQELLEISGGASWFTASFINAAARAMETLMDIGRSVGTAIRRTINGTYCPVKI